MLSLIWNSNLTNLSDINISNCKEVGEDSLYAMRGLPSLNSINIGKLPKLSFPRGVDAVMKLVRYRF